MFSQSILVPAVLLFEAFRKELPPEAWYAVAVLLVLTLVLTVASGLIYLRGLPADFGRA